MTSHEDFTTLMFHSSTEIQKPGLVWAFLKRSIPEATVEEVQRMTLTADACNAVFDVPSSRAQVNCCLKLPSFVCKLHVRKNATGDGWIRMQRAETCGLFHSEDLLPTLC